MVSDKFKPGDTVSYRSYDNELVIGIVVPRPVAVASDAGCFVSSTPRVWAYWREQTHPTYVPEDEVTLVKAARPVRQLPEWW